MKKFFASIVLAAALALSVVGCGPNIPNMENPIAGQQVPSAQGIDGSSAALGALGGAAAGYMLGKSNSNSQRPVIVQQGSSYGGYGSSYSRPYGSRSTVTTTTTRRNAFGGTTTRSTTRRR